MNLRYITKREVARSMEAVGVLSVQSFANRCAIAAFTLALTSLALPGCRLDQSNRDLEPWRSDSTASPPTAPQPVLTSAANRPVQLASYQDLEAANEPDLIRPVETPASPVQPSTFGLPDLEGLALENSPILAEKLALVDAADGQWLQAGLPPNPVIGYSGQQLGSRGQAEQQGVYLGQTFIRGGKLQLGREVATWEIEVAQQRLQAARLKLLTDVRIAYYRLLVAQQREQLAGELAALSERAEEAANSLFIGEEVSEADPLRAKFAADTARLIQYKAASQSGEAKRRLAAVIGMPDLVIGGVDGELTVESDQFKWEQTLHRILSESPELAVASAQVEVAEWNSEKAHADAIPDIDVQAVFQDDRGTGGTNGNLQVSMPIPIRNLNEGAIRKAHAETSAAHMAVDRLRLELQSRLASVFQRYDAARNRVHQFTRKDGMIETSTKTVELIRAGYEIEEFSVLDLLSAQRNLFETRLNYLDSLGDLWVARMEIDGMLLTSSY